MAVFFYNDMSSADRHLPWARLQDTNSKLRTVLRRAAAQYGQEWSPKTGDSLAFSFFAVWVLGHPNIRL